MNRAFNISYLINTVVQSFWCLLFPMGVALGIGWLMVNKLSWPEWVMVPPLILSTFVGLFSMCKFLISATNAMDKIEKQREAAREESKRVYQERQKLREDLARNRIDDSASSTSSSEENNGGDKA